MVDYLHHNQCLNLLGNCDFSQLWNKTAQKLISQGTLKTDIGRNNRPILAMKVSKEAYWIWVRNSVRSFTKTNVFLRNSGPLKISFLQCYEVHWIHNIDAICIRFVSLRPCLIVEIYVCHKKILSKIHSSINFALVQLCDLWIIISYTLTLEKIITVTATPYNLVLSSILINILVLL